MYLLDGRVVEVEVGLEVDLMPAPILLDPDTLGAAEEVEGADAMKVESSCGW